MNTEQEKYNTVYSNYENYASPHQTKIDYVEAWAKNQGEKILDAGCGRGEYCRALMRHGKIVTGVEISDVCCKKYLTDILHINTDIMSHLYSGERYDAVYCADVLEHVPPEELDTLLSSFKLVSNNFLFLVCSGSDKKDGVELHLSDHSYNEWEKIFTKHFELKKSVKGFDKWNYIHIFECESK